MLEDIEFGKMLPMKTVKTIIGKHLETEDIHIVSAFVKGSEKALESVLAVWVINGAKFKFCILTSGLK